MTLAKQAHADLASAATPTIIDPRRLVFLSVSMSGSLSKAVVVVQN